MIKLVVSGVRSFSFRNLITFEVGELVCHEKTIMNIKYVFPKLSTTRPRRRRMTKQSMDQRTNKTLFEFRYDDVITPGNFPYETQVLFIVHRVHMIPMRHSVLIPHFEYIVKCQPKTIVLRAQ